MDIGVIILSAGKGSRFGGRKQELKLDGKMLWQVVLDKALELVGRDAIIVVGEDLPGGETRTESVRIGLSKLPESIKRVVILEAARPLIKVEQINALMENAYSSVSFYNELVDTVISKNGDYLNREMYCNLQTPQSFDYKLLKEAYDSGNFVDMTDETRVMFEFHGIRPQLLLGGANLLKVTYKNDYHTILKMLEEE
ncbi:IspD/TarI family cytidylyltransferase [Vibrio splendidus]|uniref:IspD/TarI family cytidylyltransferase n=1 Tax=Vibrio splendidus TaxID=29497 RepID=UPI00076A23A6|nr:2-C-methyl-D-erythritol 4-phosphate cytidylyltransferase [Vibrio splendidus]